MTTLLTVAESAHEIRRNLDALACVLGVIALLAVAVLASRRRRQ